MCLLAQINPLKSPVQRGRDHDEVHTVQLHHAHQVCGIVAHTQDHGVASVAIRSLAIAGSVLTEPREQHEVLDILKSIHTRTGWNLKRVEKELKRAWGWEPPEPLGMGGSSGPGSAAGLAHHPGPAQPAPIVPSTRGGTLGAAAVLHQLFRPHDPPISSATGTTTVPASSTTTSTPRASSSTPTYPNDPSRRTSQPVLPLPTVEPRRSTTTFRTLSATGRTSSPSQLLYSAASTVVSASAAGHYSRGRHSSIATGSPSAHASPAATTTAAHTPTSAAATPPPPPPPPVANRSMINPLLAQADFNQPNHPYREWYKPPDRTAHSNSGGFGDGGLWPY